jgi:hypothetical protein
MPNAEGGSRVLVGVVLVAVGIAFMAFGIYLAITGRVYASLLSSASGATVLLVGADIVKE